ncbi:MAG: division/cell wall cluster transcriptional repressor MraZ [Nevskiaceae bacterium]|nr:MAG: division/cell wall cluster transcriptional repressor MraZ [Nevskiaceae bacterium]TBR73377.1 MAG: division/cell wall cluster transcriptional repressor MraZ [Nevskiaceae bacterium]
MFAGSHQLTIDDKGRLAIPARFRQQLADGPGLQLVVTKGPDHCLEIYPAAEFRRITDQIEQMENRDDAELLKMAFVGLAAEAEVDRQGRISVPPMLREMAQLDGPVVLAGQINRFNLWSETQWKEMFGTGPNSIQAALKGAFRNLRR